MVATSYANTGGTGDRRYISVSSNGIYGPVLSGDPSTLVDGVTVSGGATLNPYTADGWIMWDFGADTLPVIDGLRFYWNAALGSNQSFGSWTFEACNDNASWVNMAGPDVVFFLTGGAGAGAHTQEVTGAFQNTTGYRYWRIHQGIKSTVPLNNPGLYEVEFKISGPPGGGGDPDPGLPPPPIPSANMIHFSYGNAGGEGDRTVGTGDGTVTVTQTAGASPIADPNVLVDGDFSGANVLPDENWAFVFDFGSPKYIRQTTLWAISSSGATTKWSGSLDGVTYFEVGPNDAWVGADNASISKGNALIHIPIINNIKAWRYYKWERTSGTGTLTVHEMEFYISGGVTGLPICTYRYDGGIGDRSAIITWSTDNSMNTNQPPTLSDGLFDGGHACIFAAEADTYVQWDFIGQTVLDIFRFYGFYSSPNLHGTWNILGSNDNFATSDVVMGDFGTPGFGSSFETIMATPGGYNSYRLKNVSGTSMSTSQFITEFEFRIAPFMDFVEDGGGFGTSRTMVVA